MGPGDAEAQLEVLSGMTEAQIARVAYLVGHHHTLQDIHGMDYQILIEADYIANASENGYGKRTPVEEFTVHHRGGGGMMLHNLTEKTGLVAGIAVVDSENDVMIITDDGVIIRTGVEEIRECGRGSQGVIVMRFKAEGDRVISMALADHEEKADAPEETV